MKFYWNTPVHLHVIYHFLSRKAELNSCNRRRLTHRCLKYLFSGQLKKRFPSPCDITDKNARRGGTVLSKRAWSPSGEAEDQDQGEVMWLLPGSCHRYIMSYIWRCGPQGPQGRLSYRHGFEIELLLMQATLYSQLMLGGHLDWRSHLGMLKATHLQLNREIQDSPGGPVVKNPPSNAGHKGLIPGQGTKISHALGATKPVCHNYWACMP